MSQTDQNAGPPGADTAVAAPKRDTSSRPKRQPRYNVILLDDQDHSFEYVIAMLGQLFRHPPQRGFLMAVEVDATGRVIVLTTTLEHAELKRDQIHAFGADERIERCKGSMRAVLEAVGE